MHGLLTWAKRDTDGDRGVASRLFVQLPAVGGIDPAAVAAMVRREESLTADYATLRAQNGSPL